MPLYRRPDPLPFFPPHRLVSPPPFFPKPAAPRHKANAPAQPKPKAHDPHASVLAGVVGALALFAVFAFNILAAGLVWDSPHRSWFFLGLGCAYLGGAFLLARLLWRKWRTGRLLNGTQLAVRRRAETAGARSNTPALPARWVQPMAGRPLNAPTMALN